MMGAKLSIQLGLRWQKRKGIKATPRDYLSWLNELRNGKFVKKKLNPTGKLNLPLLSSCKESDAR
jgi:hypothetical protein